MERIYSKVRSKKSITLLELLLGLIIAVFFIGSFMGMLDILRSKSRDAHRALQAQEFLKAFEIYYINNGTYPADGIVDIGPALAFIEGNNPANALISDGLLSKIPDDPFYRNTEGYHYCSTDSNRSIILIVNTEQDNDGTDFCIIGRGPQDGNVGMCTLNGSDVNSFDLCAKRF